jgi:tRNA A37 methylthiotransferase MiaB
MKSVCILFGTGCSRARQDTRLLTRYFERNDWQITKKVHAADLVAISLCGFLELLESQSFRLLNIVQRKKKESARILAIGCLAGIKGDELEKKFGIIPINLKHPEKLDEIISAKSSLKDVLENPELHPKKAEEQMSFFSRREMGFARFNFSGDFVFTRLMHLLWKQPSALMKRFDKSMNIRIARGCEEDCTYCAIKTASGRVQSLPLDSVIQEFRNGLSNGYRMINLMAEDVGAYGQDIGLSLVDLLEGIFAHEGDYKIGFLDCSPRWLVELSPEIQEVLCANKDKIAFLGFPLQSGSDKILESMQRNYKAEDVADCLIRLHDHCPELDIVTHVMVGFPGETREDFIQTLDVVRKVPFKRVYLFRYSDRPNTESARFPKKVNPITKNSRFIQFLREFHPISHF